MIQKLTLFVKESKQELERVNWPTFQETARMTGIVVGVSLAIAMILGFFDAVFVFLIGKII